MENVQKLAFKCCTCCLTF